MDVLTPAYSHVVSEVYDGVAARLDTAFGDISKGSYKPSLGSGQVEKLMDLLEKSIQAEPSVNLLHKTGENVENACT